MAHIHTESGQHDLTVSAFIVRTDFDVPKIMFHKHKKLGVWLQFGGHVELNENPWDAITHELAEESGYTLSQLKIAQPKTRMGQLDESENHPLPFNLNTHPIDTGDGTKNHFHIDIEWVFTANAEPEGIIDEGESEEFRCFSLEELNSLPEGEIFTGTTGICRYILQEIMDNDGYELVGASDLFGGS